MAIKSKEELINSLVGYIGEDTSESAIELLDNISDTIDDLTLRASDNTDWKEKYETNDAEWRKRYIDRFSGKDDPGEGGTDLTVEVTTEETAVEETPTTYEDLFREV